MPQRPIRRSTSSFAFRRPAASGIPMRSEYCSIKRCATDSLDLVTAETGGGLRKPTTLEFTLEPIYRSSSYINPLITPATRHVGGIVAGCPSEAGRDSCYGLGYNALESLSTHVPSASYTPLASFSPFYPHYSHGHFRAQNLYAVRNSKVYDYDHMPRSKNGVAPYEPILVNDANNWYPQSMNHRPILPMPLNRDYQFIWGAAPGLHRYQ